MEPQRCWLRLKGTQRYIKNFVWRGLKFGLNLTEDEDEAVSIVSDHDDMGEVKARLIQALMRRPSPDSTPLPYTEALDAYEIVRRQFELAGRKAKREELGWPNTTYAIGTARVDIDEFRAHRQISRDNNRWVDPDASLFERSFHVLGIGKFVDADTGKWFPGMTTAGPDSALFWAFPDDFPEWPEELLEAGDIYPCDFIFDRDDEGKIQLEVMQAPSEN